MVELGTTIGYALSSEEHGPSDLVAYATLAERKGFGYALISDHFHPWIGRQGSSPFVWAVIGAIANATGELRLGTGVTCPTMRIHPAIVAQAAATAAAMAPDRFFLGVGTGENLNEHVVGAGWPEAAKRRDMLEEAVALIRELWTGEVVTRRGEYYTVEHARIYTLPDSPTPLLVAASGEHAATLAGKIGDGLIGLAPDSELTARYDREAGSDGDPGPKVAQLTVCWAEDEKAARRTAFEWWPQSGLPGELSQELATPEHFEQAVGLVSEEALGEKLVCGPDPAPYGEAIQEYLDAGYDNVYLHQVGPDQEGFLEFAAAELLPEF